jgi:hypothetical protein
MGGWFRNKLRGAISMLPLEEVVATITREVVQELIEQAESAGERQPDEEAGATEAEA